MNLTPQSEDVIARSLRVLRWQNRIASVIVGGVGVPFFSMLFPSAIAYLPALGVLGAVAGLITEQRHWRRLMSKLNQSFIRLNTDGLEVQGLAGGGMAHVRFRLQDILGVEIGYRQESLAGALPSVRAIRSNALVIREKSGAVISFELAGVLFRSEDLTRLLATLAPLIGK